MTAGARRGVALMMAGALSALAGCRQLHERQGDDAFTRGEVLLVPGETTAREAAEMLGPPDEIELHGERLRFVYHFRRNRERRFILSLRLDLFSWKSGEGHDERLILDFDADDRLLYTTRERKPLDRSQASHLPDPRASIPVVVEPNPRIPRILTSREGCFSALGVI